MICTYIHKYATYMYVAGKNYEKQANDVSDVSSTAIYYVYVCTYVMISSTIHAIVSTV